jgi:hypothetical protein
MWTLDFLVYFIWNNSPYRTCTYFSNCDRNTKLYFSNKYQQEYSAHGNKARALQRVITKVGTATLMTNLTQQVLLPS